MLTTLTSTLLSALLVYSYSAIFIFLPGYLITKSLKLNRLSAVSLSLITGFSLFSLVTYFFRAINLPFFIAEGSIIILSLYLIYRHKITPVGKIKLPKPTLAQIIFALIALAGALIQGMVLYRSGIATSGGINFVNLSLHDSMQHLTIIQRLYQSSQITHPGFAGTVIKNYHYLIDLSIAAITRFNFVSLFDTYYRIYPFTISIIFSLSIFTFTRYLTKNETTANLALAFSLFSGNASFFAQFIRGENFRWAANTFMINPLTDILQNPASVFVLAQTLSVIYLFSIYTKHNKSSPNHNYTLLSLSLIAGTMISFKAWGGLLIISGLLLASLWHFIKTRDHKPILSWILAALISAALFLPGFDPTTSASPMWLPGWTLKRMVEDPDRWNAPYFTILEQHYISKNNIPRIAYINAQQLFVYIIGNFWIRLIGFITLARFLFKRLQISAPNLLMLYLVSASFALPLLFNQGRMAYDIEQFAPYSMLLISIFTAIELGKFQQFLIKKKLSKSLGLVIAAVLLVITTPSNWASIKPRLKGERTLFTNDRLSTYQQIKDHTTLQDTILVYPSHRQIADLHFTALTNRNTFYSGRTLANITGEDHPTREKELIRFFSSQASQADREKLITQNQITHLFLYSDETFSPDPSISEQLFQTKTGSFYRYTIK